MRSDSTGRRDLQATLPNDGVPIERDSGPDKEKPMIRRRAADDFAAIRTRMDELRRERAQASDDNAARSSEDGRSFETARRPKLSPLSDRDPSRTPAPQSRH
jgi:hypothetical protein